MYRVQRSTSSTTSHPSRVCGLKYSTAYVSIKPTLITPLTGVRIEIFGTWKESDFNVITPLTGVRIEIFVRPCVRSSTCITPLTGVRIEMPRHP